MARKNNPYYEMDMEEKMLAREARKYHKKEARMRVEKRGANSTSLLRFFVVALVILFHILILVAIGVLMTFANREILVDDSVNSFEAALLLLLDTALALIYIASRIVAVFVVVRLFGREWNSAFKLPWTILILLSPVVGLLLYAILGRKGTAGTRHKRLYAKLRQKIFPHYHQDEEIMNKYKTSDPELYHQLYYINKIGPYVSYQNTDVKYYPQGKEGLEAQIEELKKAEKFILFEYHAIENQEAFERIKLVLFEKAAQGVEVRVFYDDMGSIGFINRKFRKEMIEHGIKCRVFNPLKPAMIFFMNNRDHRKITVIDGKVGFTGGYNMADEYFDITHPYGEWKDTGIRVMGDAVNSLSLIFLENWNGIKNTDSEEDIMKFIVDNSDYHAQEPNGVILPYADGPIDSEPLAETAYMNLIRDSKHYICISTPYLIITDEMTRELVDAAKRGLDVRIITPGIPDKKVVYKMTRSYYMTLAKGGVKIYEYKPGFVHSKMMVVDDHMAIVGTINFDYRSLYHHFENACFIANYKAVYKIRHDFTEMIEKSRDVTERHAQKKRLGFGEMLIRLIAPLM